MGYTLYLFRIVLQCQVAIKYTSSIAVYGMFMVENIVESV